MLVKTPDTGGRVLYLLSDENVEHQQERREYLHGAINLSAEKPVPIHLPDVIPDGIYLLSFRNNELTTYLKIIVDKL